MGSKTIPTVVSVILVLVVLGIILYRWNWRREHLNSQNNTLVQPPKGATTQKTETPMAANPAEASPGSTLSVQTNPGSSSTSVEAQNQPQNQKDFKPDLTVDAKGLSATTAVIKLSNGTVKFKFYPLDAPQTVNRILFLIQSGFYNGLTFHRVEPDFVVQGGDPTGTGSGGSGQKQKAEFNKRNHVEGTVAMARARDPDSADSQFYICLTTTPHLDNQYTVFGQVIEGMDLIKKIKKGDKMFSVSLE